MSNQVATRDLVGALAYLAGIIMLLMPFRHSIGCSLD